MLVSFDPSSLTLRTTSTTYSSHSTPVLCHFARPPQHTRLIRPQFFVTSHDHHNILVSFDPSSLSLRTTSTTYSSHSTPVLCHFARPPQHTRLIRPQFFVTSHDHHNILVSFDPSSLSLRTTSTTYSSHSTPVLCHFARPPQHTRLIRPQFFVTSHDLHNILVSFDPSSLSLRTTSTTYSSHSTPVLCHFARPPQHTRLIRPQFFVTSHDIHNILVSFDPSSLSLRTTTTTYSSHSTPVLCHFARPPQHTRLIRPQFFVTSHDLHNMLVSFDPSSLSLRTTSTTYSSHSTPVLCHFARPPQHTRLIRPQFFVTSHDLHNILVSFDPSSLSLRTTSTTCSSHSTPVICHFARPPQHTRLIRPQFFVTSHDLHNMLVSFDPSSLSLRTTSTTCSSHSTPVLCHFARPPQHARLIRPQFFVTSHDLHNILVSFDPSSLSLRTTSTTFSSHSTPVLCHFARPPQHARLIRPQFFVTSHDLHNILVSFDPSSLSLRTTSTTYSSHSTPVLPSCPFVAAYRCVMFLVLHPEITQHVQ